MSLKLRDLIRQVRACKTAAEERAVIAKESAMIRTAIREEQEQYRHRNVAKLLFMHMLGYPTHFGQLECMKLVASPHFPEKRIGYLGMMLLLSEQADVLMLATNSLKNDLNSTNKFIAGLALCAIGNLATGDMSRDLAPEVDKHLGNAKPYLRKKACLAMARCLTKCPDMVEDFVDRVVTLLNDKSHGVLITVVQLMTRVLVIDRQDPCRTAFLKLVPSLVKLLRNLLSMGYSPDHDVGGISDPFLQVQLLTLLRLLGAHNVKASEEMNDVLAQVATNTETSKNAGNAILYECVQTIMAVESDDGLRVLAVNILGRFLLNRDNNIRYVALNTLAKCIADQQTARHRTTVVDCLKDPDISIRQRALELIYHLVNQENVEALTAELLNYLVLCPREHRSDICTRVLRVVDKFSPDDRWRVDTLITMLTIAGRESATNVQSSTVVYISRSSEDLRAYSTHKLLKALRDDDGTQRGLLNVGIWCIGEYGDLLLSPYSYNPPLSSDELAPATVTFMALEPSAVVEIVEQVMNRPSCSLEVKQRVLTCFTKLQERFVDSGDAATLDKLQNLVKKHEGSHSLELQLRSCEYGALINAIKGVALKRASGGEDDIFGDIFGGGGTPAPATQNGSSSLSVIAPAKAEPVQSDVDLLSDIFSAPAAPIAAPSPSVVGGFDIFSQPAAQTTTITNDLFAPQPMAAPAPSAPIGSPMMDPFGSSAPAPTPTMQPQQTMTSSVSIAPTATPVVSAVGGPTPSAVTVQGFSHQGLTVEFECTKPDTWNKQNSVLVAKFINTTDAPLYGLHLQVAVPKYVTMEMKPPTSTTVPVTGGSSTKHVTQTISVTNTMLGTKNLMLKLKASFTSKGTKVEHLATCSGFPAGQY
ncbi:gamma subunit of tetrameric clathrin adaptor complex AP2 [Thalassiosira pseudonana CCMP1335]|uniref:AP-1 complex subunit gamma n=1 Tax=Thalassiosira pseudonana TaxID=35128 RepID=B8CC79_THAPS|nr:gamma subunit of tetrameric clathrin adaptor complex AP2 [Thalassiosira pseudonana CCMP1335]EED88719.1 gamma subunit of tetrameric clathrin adaptor complex AP2 [Thalassiosira pseudonana CCMP1335]